MEDSNAVDAEQLISSDEEDDVEDVELKLQHEKEYQNKLEDLFDSGDEEVKENGYNENEDHSLKPYDENLEEQRENHSEYRFNFQQNSVDASIDNTNSNEDIGHETSECYFKSRLNGREWGNEISNDQHLEENEEESCVNTENENSNKLTKYLLGNGDRQDFLNDDNNGDVLKWKSLSAAKDRQIEILNKQLADQTNRWQTENAALIQQLQETEGSRDCYISEFNNCRSLLDQANAAGLELQGQLGSLESEYAALDQNRNEIFTKLTSAEATIKGLQDKVNGLLSSESMMRVRDNNLKTINNLNENHKKEILNYKNEIDILKEGLNTKGEEVEIFREELDKVRTELEVVKLEKLASVNKLIKDLEVSQENYQKLMKSKNEGKSEDQKLLLKHLQEELTSVKHELDAYRKASKLNLNSSPKPKSVSSDGLPPYTQENLLSLLKNELQLSTTSLSAKNDELKKMKGDLLTSESNVRHFREQALVNENLLVECQEKIKTLTNELNQSKLTKDANSSAILKDLETLKKQKEALKVELQESKRKVEELTPYKEKMNEFTKNAWKERSKINDEHERDKDAALQLEQEKAAKNVKVLKQQYEARVKKVTDELTEVKNLYVNVCKEKDGIYERLKAEGEVEKNKLKEIWDKEKRIETETSKRELSQEVSKQVAEKVKHAKQLWEREQTIKIQENVLAQAKEMFQHFQTEKVSDSAENEIADNYLEHIKELEARAKETEEAFQKHLQGCEWKQLKDIKVALERQKEQMAKEFKERLQTEKLKLITEIGLENQKKMQEKEKELQTDHQNQKQQALEEQESQFGKELENFLSTQNQKYLTALNAMKENHAKEKIEFRKYHDDIVSQLNEQCKNLLETISELQRSNREQLVKDKKEISSLLNDLESAKEKCARLENDKTSLASKSQLDLKTRKLELEDEYKSKLDQNEQDWASRQEQRVVNPLRKEMATLMAKVRSAEDLSAQLRLQLEKSTMECKAIQDKYAILKEKVQKYHRYIHRKEKEFRDSLLKMNDEQKTAINKIANMGKDPGEVGDKLYNLLLSKETNASAESNNRPRTQTHKMFPEQPHVQESEAEMLMKTLKTTIEQLHGEKVKYISLQDEMTKASLHFYDHLKSLSNQAVDSAPPASKQTSVYGGSRSSTATPEPHTNGSSGRGTMVGNSAGSASEGGGGNEIMYRTNGSVANKPLKFYSSTPFHPCEARFGDASNIPVTISKGMNFNCKNVKDGEVSDEWGASTFKGNNNSRKKVNAEAEDSDDARLTKLTTLSNQVFARSAYNFAAHSLNNKAVESPRSIKKRIKSSSDLPTLKDDFRKHLN